MEAKGTRRVQYSRPSPTEGLTAPGTASPIKVFTTTLTVPTRERTEICNLTDQLAAIPALQQISHGYVLLHSLHTTTGLCLNEFQEALLHDITTLLRRLIPSEQAYRHNDPAVSDDTRGNATGHLSAILLGQTLQIPVEHGRLMLGTWQSVLFCEFDGPQTRNVYVQVMGV